MDPAAKRWLREYKKLFDEVSRLNAGNGAAEMLGNVVEKSNVTATTAPDKVIRRIGKIVDDSDNSPKTIKKIGRIVENAQKTPLTNINQGNMNVSGREAIELNENNIPFVVVEDDILEGIDRRDWISTVKKNLSDKYPNGITLKNNTVVIDRQSRKEMTFSKYMTWLRANDPQAFSDKLRATNNTDEILHATTDWVSEGLKHPRQDNIVDFARGNVLIRVGNNDYIASVIVGTKKNGTMIMYDIIDLKRTTIKTKEMVEAIPENPSRGAERKTSTISINNIHQTDEKINSSGKNF